MSGADLTQGAALSAILGAEGFLLAAVALALRLGEPNQDGVQKYRWIGSPQRIAKVAAFAMLLIAVGAFAAWWSIFGGGLFAGWTRAGAGGALLLALVAQPAFGLLLAFGAERD